MEKIHRKIAMRKFNLAIATGILSENKTADNYAGHFMYMHTDEDGIKDYFKDIMTRQYVICNVSSGSIFKSFLHSHASRESL